MYAQQFLSFLTRGYLVVGLGVISVATQLHAKTVNIVPSSEHSALTMTTDESYGYQVLPGNPLKLDLAGPGSLTISVRLNAKNKRTSLSGQLEIKRSKRRVKLVQLKLMNSRVGGYREDPGLVLSLPKVIKLQVPKGIQNYTFSLKAARGVSMTLYIGYESDVDQTPAKTEEDTLALVPLVPEENTEPGGSGEATDTLPLVPGDSSVAAVSNKKTETATGKEKPEQGKGTKGRPELSSSEETKPVEVAEKTHENSLSALQKLIKPKNTSTDKDGNKMASAQDGSGSSNPPKDELSVEDRVSAVETHVVSLGLKGGQISPFPYGWIAATNYIFSLDMRYVLPVFEERLSLGVEVSFYPLQKEISYPSTSKRDEYSLSVIPFAVQLFYRFPLHTIIEPYIGGGGDLFVCFGEAKTHDANGTRSIDSGTAIVFGGHVALGFEVALGPGFLMVEARLGGSTGDTPVYHEASISGISTVAGYRFVF